MADENKNPVEVWNKAIDALLKAKEAWAELQFIVHSNQVRAEDLPIKAQKFFGLATVRTSFEIALPRLIDYYRVSGGLNELLVEQPPEKKLKKETKDGRSKKRKL